MPLPSRDGQLNEDTERPIRILNQNGQHISYDGGTIELLGDLMWRRLQVKHNTEPGPSIRKGATSLLRRDDGGRLPNAGTFPAQRYRAFERGTDLRRVISPPLAELPVPEPTCIAHLWHPHVAGFVRDVSLGRIGIHPGISPSSVIGDIAYAYPRVLNVVLGEHRRQLDKIRDNLRSRGINAVSVFADTPLVFRADCDDEYPQVICATPLAAANIPFATAQIVIVLDAYACHHAQMQMALSQIDGRFRLFGLFDTTRVPAPSEADAAFAAFGEQMITLQGVERKRRTASIAFVYTPPPKNELALTDVKFASACFWHHHRRNRQTAQLAGQLYHQLPINPRKFPEVARVITHPTYQHPSVTVLADRPYHAFQLSRLLPGWPVIASDDAIRGLCGSFRRQVHQQRREWHTGTNQIVLADVAHLYRGELSDVVIWAGGGSSIDAIPDRWFDAEYGVEKPLLIVDFLDQHNKDAAKLSCQRRDEYHRRDIFPAGVSAELGRIARFLHDRPTGDNR